MTSPDQTPGASARAVSGQTSLVLVVRSAGRAGQTLTAQTELVLGRDSFRQFGLADARVSRRHARLWIDPDGTVRLEDLGSSNGTFRNGERISSPVPVLAGDTVLIGETTLEILAVPAPRRPPGAGPPGAGPLGAGPDGAGPADAGPALPAPRAPETVIRWVPATPASPPARVAPASPPVPGVPDTPPTRSLPPVTPAAPAPARAAAAAPIEAGAGGPPDAPAGSVAVAERPPPASPAPAPKRARQALPPFPNYTQIPAYLSVRGWWVVRAIVLVSYLGEIALLFAVPSLGLRLMWGIGIPLLPIFFFLAPGIWRNICPLASSNQVPRKLGFTQAKPAPEWLKRHGYAISIFLFFAFVSLRKIGLQDNGPGTGLLLLACVLSAFTGGVLLKGKSGWCSSICPLLPVQRAYGQTPFVLVGNAHCQPCVGCAKNCFDFNPKVALLADLHEDPTWSAGRKYFLAAFPGLILGFFRVPDVPMASVPVIYGELCLYIAASVGIFFLIDSYTRLSTHKLTTIYAATALNIFYWFGVPHVYQAVTSAVAPMPLVWAARAVLLAITCVWVVRTILKERAFLQRAGGQAQLPAQIVTGARGDSIASHAAASQGKPEVTFLPDKRQVIADPGRTILELAEANNLPIEAGCRMGICGADPVAIVEGMANISGMTDDERATLERLGLAENTRLACCCRVSGPVSVSLTPEQPAQLRPSQILRLDFDRSVQRVVVIGNGIAGITAADYARRNHPECSVDVVADEAYHLYNRMAITRLIYGRSAMQGLYLNPDAWYDSRSITPWLNTRVREIDREARVVVTGTGERLPYDRLILATGSSSTVPPITGWGLPGTFVLRSADDALRVRAFAQLHGARRAVVGGGGLLGLEAAYALHKLGLATTVLERSERLLRRQLDARAGELLLRYLEGIGISVWTQAETAEVSGTDGLGRVTLGDGRSLDAEVLIIAAGITPNVGLAARAGLATGSGVLVDEFMRTSDERILAAGDVAEFPGQVPGLWPTAVEQARVAGERAVLSQVTPYAGTMPVTVLKVVGVDLTSIGRIEPGDPRDEVIVQEEGDALRYGKLIISGTVITGAILLGYSAEVAAVTSAVKQGWDISPILGDLRTGRWESLERLGSGRSLSPLSVVGG